MQVGTRDGLWSVTDTSTNKLILSVGTKQRSWKDAIAHLYSLRTRLTTSLFPTHTLSLSLRIITRVRSLAWGLAYSDKYISTEYVSVIVTTNDYRDPSSRTGKWTCVHRESEVRRKTGLGVWSVCVKWAKAV